MRRPHPGCALPCCCPGWAIAQDASGAKQARNDLGINPSAERNPETERLGERATDLEMKFLISDLSKSAELKDKHIDTRVKNLAVTLRGTVETAPQKYAAEQIAWQVPGVQSVTNDLSVTNAQAAPRARMTSLRAAWSSNCTLRRQFL